MAEEEKPESKSLVERFIGMVLAPRETFRSVVAFPSSLGVLLLTSFITAIFVGGFLSTRVGQDAWLSQALESVATAGEPGDDARQSIETIKPYVGALAAAQSLIVVPLWTLGAAGMLFLVFTVALGATASFRELFAVVAHAGAITAVAQCFIWPLNYVRGDMSSPSTLAAFVPMLDETSFLFRTMNFIDLFLVWWIVVLSVGLGVLYRRSAQPIAVALMLVYLVVAVAVAAIRVALSF